MSTVAPTNPGLADLLQNLTSFSPALSSQLSSPAMQSALENAPAGDIVQLSNEAMQLSEVGTLFGDSSQTASSTIDPASILSALYPSLTSTPTTVPSLTPASSDASDSSTTLAGEMAGYQSALQSQQVETLFGTPPTTSLNSLFNVVG